MYTVMHPLPIWLPAILSQLPFQVSWPLDGPCPLSCPPFSPLPSPQDLMSLLILNPTSTMQAAGAATDMYKGGPQRQLDQQSQAALHLAHHKEGKEQ